MKTLIIHPEDPSTSFLDIVYNPIPNKTVITKDKTKKEIIELIESHDQVMLMGHGVPQGLLAVRQFPTYDGLVIDRDMVDSLSKKDNTVYIWCNADQFVNRYNLKGFYTGMFISEVYEAGAMGLGRVKQQIVDESNMRFCNVLSEVITEDTETIFNKISEEYGELAMVNEVAQYNFERLYLRK